MSDRLQKLKNQEKEHQPFSLKSFSLIKNINHYYIAVLKVRDNKYYGVRIENFKQKDYEKIIPLKVWRKKGSFKAL